MSMKVIVGCVGMAIVGQGPKKLGLALKELQDKGPPTEDTLMEDAEKLICTLRSMDCPTTVIVAQGHDLQCKHCGMRFALEAFQGRRSMAGGGWIEQHVCECCERDLSLADTRLVHTMTAGSAS